MDYPSIRGDDFPDYSKTPTWNFLNAYIYAHIQRKYMNIQEMEYNPSQDFNTNVQTKTSMKISGTIEFSITCCTKEGSQKSTISRYFKTIWI